VQIPNLEDLKVFMILHASKLIGFIIMLVMSHRLCCVHAKNPDVGGIANNCGWTQLHNDFLDTITTQARILSTQSSTRVFRA
jgi:hypothetical protein